MAQSILIFDFGTNEEAAQEARHKIEGWQQGMRLGKKIVFKFEREESGGEATPEPDTEATGSTSAKEKPSKGKAPAKPKAKAETSKAEKSKNDAEPDEKGSSSAASSARVRLLIRLAFSDHEKLTQQRWLDRIPAEKPFKSAKGETIRQGGAAFAETSELFDSLD